MKHLFLSFSLAALTGVAFANPVSVQTAQTAASNFMSRKVGNAVLTLTSSVPSNTATAQPAFYIFDVNNGNGFVIVSGDDAVTPILAYSEKNRMPAQITNKEVLNWLGGYNKQISFAISNHLVAASEVASEWTTLNAGSTNDNVAAKPTGVSPLILTTWDQWDEYSGGQSNTLYNNLCPAGAPTGCVATAMAQIMYFWNSPTLGLLQHSYSSSTIGGTLTANFGATTYDWNHMPLTLDYSSTTAQQNAVATLMFHCGVSVDMDYNYGYLGGSGAQVINYYGQGGTGYPCSENAMPKYFGYKSTIKGVMRQFYSDAQWINMLKFEIDNGRPVLHTGFGSDGGHAFDFDGYNDQNKFDINWGWSGQGNGYYTVNNLVPSFGGGVGAGNGDFNEGQQALIQIEPATHVSAPNPNYPDFPTMTLALNAAIKQSADTIIYNTAFSDTAQIKNMGTDTLDHGTLYLVATDAGNNAFILNQKVVTINPGASLTYTFATAGSTTLVPGAYTLKYKYVPASYIDTNKILVGNGVSTNSKTLFVKAAPTSITNVALNGAALNVYPNPSHNFVTLDWKGYTGKVSAVELFNVIGQKVASYTNISGTNTQIPVNQLSAGNYIVNIVTELGTLSKEISVK